MTRSLTLYETDLRKEKRRRKKRLNDLKFNLENIDIYLRKFSNIAPQKHMH